MTELTYMLCWEDAADDSAWVIRVRRSDDLNGDWAAVPA